MVEVVSRIDYQEKGGVSAFKAESLAWTPVGVKNVLGHGTRGNQVRNLVHKSVN